MHRAVALATLVLAIPALAEDPDANGYTWATIGHAGNRPTNADETPRRPTMSTGAVDYEYRMATTEVTLGQWLEFVQAYAPYHPDFGGDIIDPYFTSSQIRNYPDGLQITPGVSANRAADMSWEYAARYCNWLHNGKVSEQWAFESGAYDASTFTFNPDGSANHQATRTDGARYWIPNLDEWNKAAYYDPDRYGTDEEGYWLYPTSSNEVPIPSLLPNQGGERNAGPLGDSTWPLDVGSYSEITSPWGLFDMAGGVQEWLETTTLFGGLRWRLLAGSHFGDDSMDPFFNYDRIDVGTSVFVNASSSFIGLRLAASIPCTPDLAPPTGVLDTADITAFIDRYLSADPTADLAEPLGVINFFDIARFLDDYNAGCP